MELSSAMLTKVQATLRVPEEKLLHPIFIQMVGAPAWGKTRLVEQVCGKLPLACFSASQVRKALFPQAEFSPAENRLIFEEILPNILQDCAKKGQSLIVDANIGLRAHRKQNAILAKSLGMRVLTVVTRCPDEVALARLVANRSNPWRIAQKNEYITPLEAYGEQKRKTELPGWLEPHFTFYTHKDQNRKFSKLIQFIQK